MNRKPSTHCTQGHPLTEANKLPYQKNGKTYYACRRCNYERTRKWRSTKEAKQWLREYSKKRYQESKE